MVVWMEYDSHGNKDGHLYCRICIGIVVSNYCRILCSKVANKVSEFQVECGSNPSSDRIPTVDLMYLKYL